MSPGSHPPTQAFSVAEKPSRCLHPERPPWRTAWAGWPWRASSGLGSWWPRSQRGQRWKAWLEAGPGGRDQGGRGAVARVLRALAQSTSCPRPARLRVSTMTPVLEGQSEGGCVEPGLRGRFWSFLALPSPALRSSDWLLQRVASV